MNSNVEKRFFFHEMGISAKKGCYKHVPFILVKRETGFLYNCLNFPGDYTKNLTAHPKKSHER